MRTNATTEPPRHDRHESSGTSGASGGSVRFALGLREIDRTQSAVVGGKGANLGELTRIDGVVVPPGFCVTTDAFRRMMAAVPSIDEHLDRLSRLGADERSSIRTASAEIRDAIEHTTVPADLAAEISGAIAHDEGHVAYAVRSSATAEDLPSASFAGQQDTHLNIIGSDAILHHVRACWASLFTERAVAYRLRNGFDHRAVHMAVVVQRMVLADAAGVMFTADPVTSNRTVVTVEATFGLGEALVSGFVNADTYSVRGGDVVTTAIAAKQVEIVATPAGGTEQRAIDSDRQRVAALTEAQVLELARLGRRIEAHFGSPQDIEWCLVGDRFQIVQSRPITTLFPVPVIDDDQNHVYVSVGHQQMMTDPMKPLGLSLFQLTALRPMHEAAGRLFVDVAMGLTTPTNRAAYLDALGKSDPLIRDALETILDRGDFIPSLPDDGPGAAPPLFAAAEPIETDASIVEELKARTRASIATLEHDIRSTSGVAVIDLILDDIQELKRRLFDPQSMQVIIAAIDGTFWLNERLEEWLGEKNAADTLTQSAPDNVTSEMGLALLDVADAIRPYPEVVAFLREADGDGFLDELIGVDGGSIARDAIQSYLDRYGMRCVGEIDITRPRWSERPSTLVPLILGNVKNFEPGAGARRFADGLEAARRKEQNVLERLRALPDGQQKADETKRTIDRVRTFIGYREYPKYGIVCRYMVYKRALLDEAERLVRSGVITASEDIFFLTFPELHEVLRTNDAGPELIRRRKNLFRSYESLTPPRVLTSDGEIVNGKYRRDDLPDEALIGLPVSAGTIEGRARVILDMADADVEAGDILVTAYTDPSWSPLFVAIAGLVTEVGGMMTHGAVIAREYGLPAVVGVENATRLIRDGQRIRVHGSDGYIEILPAP